MKDIKPTDKDTLIVEAEATSTSAADFTLTKVKPTVFKRTVKYSQLTGVTAEAVEP